MSKKTALYEVIFVTRPDLSRQDVDKLSDEYTAVLKEQGGKEIKREYWGLRSLAYKVQKLSKGHYTLLGVEATPEAIAEIARLQRINEQVIRSITVTVDAIDEKPSPLLRSQDDNDNARAA